MTKETFQPIIDKINWKNIADRFKFYIKDNKVCFEFEKDYSEWYGNYTDTLIITLTPVEDKSNIFTITYQTITGTRSVTHCSGYGYSTHNETYIIGFDEIYGKIETQLNVLHIFGGWR